MNLTLRPMNLNLLRSALIAFSPVLLSAQSLQDFEKRVTEFTLGNGMHFIILERHEAPVVSFHSYVNAGAVDDPSGQTGIAHMFEHMAFKGTETIGTKNWPAEMLLATAFAAHPYHDSPAGWASDIENLRVPDAVHFYKKYYVPANITVGIAGDVDPAECKRLADKYFSIIPSGPSPGGPVTVEPPQHG